VKNTLIGWCHHTVNLWWGCEFARHEDGTISQECVHCYAKALSAYYSKGQATWGKDGKRWVRVEAALRELYAMEKSAAKRGVRERVFINSMSDTFEDRRDLDAAREALWAAVMLCPNLDFLLLTKRPENIERMTRKDWWVNWPKHVWVGTTAATQQSVDQRLHALLHVPAHIRFVSCEPLLEDIDLGLDPLDPFNNLEWVICGGESGNSARPMAPGWARNLLHQCSSVGEAFFMKQMGGKRDARHRLEDLPEDLRVRQFPA
jgi:protein gp37